MIMNIVMTVMSFLCACAPSSSASLPPQLSPAFRMGRRAGVDDIVARGDRANAGMIQPLKCPLRY